MYANITTSFVVLISVLIKVHVQNGLNWSIWWRHADRMLTFKNFLMDPNTHTYRPSLKSVSINYTAFMVFVYWLPPFGT